MPPRVQSAANRVQHAIATQYMCRQCRHASLTTSTTPAPTFDRTTNIAAPIVRHPSTQPPSYKPPEFRKSQLHRQYQSLLRSAQLMLVFQHNNLKSTEWMGIRRELALAMRKVDEELAKAGNNEYRGSDTKLQVVQTGIFESALKVVEFWDPKFDDSRPALQPTGPEVASSSRPNNDNLTHGLSQKAWRAANKNKKLRHGLEPLLSGPLALLTIPSVSPQHLKAALSILSPSPQFPAPRRRTNPSYHEPAVQNGLSKLMLLGARIEGKVFDVEGAKWVGGIPGGLDGLRAQLVAMLSGVGAQITNTLDAASRSLYVTVEGRRGMLEEEEKSKAGSA